MPSFGARQNRLTMCSDVRKEKSVMALSHCSISNERVLLREITHRINNEFASVIQVMSFAAARSADHNVKAAFAGVMEQLHNYARVHHALQMPARHECIDASAYPSPLCGSINRSKLQIATLNSSRGLPVPNVV
jgi:two-component sensor histidine kinase